jgi:hypothetical protein
VNSIVFQPAAGQHGFRLLALPPRGSEHRYILTLSPAQLEAAVAPKLRDLAARLGPPGVPASQGWRGAALDARLRDGLASEYARAVALDAARSLLREAGLWAAAPPRLRFLPPGDHGGLRVQIDLEAAPRPAPPSLQGIHLPRPGEPPPRQAEAVRAALQRLAMQHAPGRAAAPGHVTAPGDLVSFDILARPLARPGNLLRNPAGLGNPAPGLLPAHWSIAYVKEGLARFAAQGGEDGLPCIDLCYSGTISPALSPQISPERPGHVAVRPGERLRLEGTWRLLFGALPAGTRASLLMEERDAEGRVLHRPIQPMPCPGPDPLAAQRFSLAFTVADPAARTVQPVLRLRPPAEAAVDFTLRLGGLVLTRDDPVARAPDPALTRQGLAQRLGGAGDADAIPGLAQRLAGRRRGECFIHDAVLPGQPEEHRLEVTLRGIRRPGAVGPGLARRLGHATPGALRRAMEAQLRADWTADAQAARRRSLLDALLARLSAAPPEAWVDQHHARLRGALEERIAAGRLSPQEQAQGPGALRGALRTQALRLAAAGLLAELLGQAGDPAPNTAAATAEARHAALLDRLLAALPAGG